MLQALLKVATYTAYETVRDVLFEVVVSIVQFQGPSSSQVVPVVYHCLSGYAQRCAFNDPTQVAISLVSLANTTDNAFFLALVPFVGELLFDDPVGFPLF
jgi:hypothetical protein